jgi:cyclopropane-fatty-acyl-phospholipid synthase
MKFIAKEIFPGGQLSPPKSVIRQACNAGFRVAQAQSLRQHYGRTLDIWAENLQANREQAIRLKSTADYDRFMKYLTGCAERFRAGYIDVFQFTCLPIQ